MFKKYSIPYSLDDPKTTLAHRDIILNKPFLKRLYQDWYDVFIKESRSVGKGIYLEIGSGGGFLKDVFPEVVTSDILDLPVVDKVFSAEELPYKERAAQPTPDSASRRQHGGWSPDRSGKP